MMGQQKPFSKKKCPPKSCISEKILATVQRCGGAGVVKAVD